jgi:hypothetical protein
VLGVLAAGTDELIVVAVTWNVVWYKPKGRICACSN